MYITNNYPYYQTADKGWQNSIPMLYQEMYSLSRNLLIHNQELSLLPDGGQGLAELYSYVVSGNLFSV